MIDLPTLLFVKLFVNISEKIKCFLPTHAKISDFSTAEKQKTSTSISNSLTPNDANCLVRKQDHVSKPTSFPTFPIHCAYQPASNDKV